MKKLLTIVVCDGTQDVNTENFNENIEITVAEQGNVSQAIKNSKAKFTFVSDCGISAAETDFFLETLREANTDMVLASDVCAVKTSVLKDCDLKNADAFTYNAFGAMNCKTLKRIRCVPFMTEKQKLDCSDKTTHNLLCVAEEFKKVKSKLNKDIYAYVFDTLCDRLVTYYMTAVLAVKDGDLPAEKLIEFDNRLKGEIVLFLALEKRFTATKLQKLREKGFKISGLKARKFRKLLNI